MTTPFDSFQRIRTDGTAFKHFAWWCVYKCFLHFQSFVEICKQGILDNGIFMTGLICILSKGVLFKIQIGSLSDIPSFILIRTQLKFICWVESNFDTSVTATIWWTHTSYVVPTLGTPTEPKLQMLERACIVLWLHTVASKVASILHRALKTM